MSSGNLIFLVLIVGAVFAMFSMHRGGHGHGGMGGGHGGGGGGHGGGCGGGGHSHGGGEGEHSHHTADAEDTKPLLGPPGTASNEPTPAPAQGHRHRGC